MYETVEVKGKLVANGETMGYWDPVNMSRCCNFLCVDECCTSLFMIKLTFSMFIL